jgi:hypothetical protein
VEFNWREGTADPSDFQVVFQSHLQFQAMWRILRVLSVYSGLLKRPFR